MARKTAEEAQKTRLSLLKAAQTLFAEQGVSQTTLVQIARKAGLSRGAVHWHFESKVDLLRALWSETKGPVNRFQEQLNSQANGYSDFDSLRTALLGGLMAAVSDHEYRQSLRIMLFNSEKVGELAECLEQEEEQIDLILDALEQLLIRLKGNGELAAEIDPRMAAAGLMSYVIGLIYEFLKQPERVALDRDAEALLDIYLRGLKP